jgi:CHAT domain-containing protein/tetratricopeptide (TPR) repeat protein
MRGLWRLAFAGLLFLFLPVRDSSAVNPQVDYDHARQLFLRGFLEQSQRQAELGYRRFARTDAGWAAKFQLLEAEAMEWRGLYEGAEHILAAAPAGVQQDGDAVRRKTIESVALIRLHRFPEADVKLTDAERLCAGDVDPGCGGVIRARGLLAMERGRFSDAQRLFLESLDTARARSDRWLEATALLNLSAAMLQQEHFDEALDWSRSAQQAALSLDGQDIEEAALGNLGWAYLGLGDTDRALELFEEAEKRAAQLGDLRDELKWVSTAGNAYVDSGDLKRAGQSFGLALTLAKQIASTGDIVDTLEDLAHVSIASGNLEEADSYLGQLAPYVRATISRLDDLDVMLAQGKIAAARRQDQQAEAIFRAVEKDPDSQTSMRLGAEHELARLFEVEHDLKSADLMYRTALTSFEAERSELKGEESKLPFLTNATPIYDDYIHFLVDQGKGNEALTVADQSRARTLTQGLGLGGSKSSRQAPPQPAEVARKSRATLLFYWLGGKQSYLWAITPRKTALFPLPPQSQLYPLIDRYGRALLGPEDPLESGNEDGRALYNILVAPAAATIQPGEPVMLLTDGALSRLNFETLLAPGAATVKLANAANPSAHYWIDDVTVISAQSFSMLMAAKPSPSSGGKLLLLGDAVSPDQDYPELPMAALEMRQIERHFKPQDATVFTREKAVPAVYLASNPGQYSYIHFVTHGVASRVDPLDSAIILSRAGGTEDSFKLHARDIIRHPIDARLVTISACYGNGQRSYAGEGLVGLSWAFLRAGAHNVIGALWEASDDSTPQLMDKLYGGLEAGQAPGDALRNAKLSLLHSDGPFRKPFFWASFQIYTGQ